MKRLFLCAFFAVAAFLGISASAANGDIAGTIYSTDILTQLDGRDIPSYNIDGRTMIALEDLEQYGFNVKYDDSIRAVFIKTVQINAKVLLWCFRYRHGNAVSAHRNLNRVCTVLGYKQSAGI